MKARTTARTIEARLPQPAAVATAIPTTSPRAHAIRQCVVADSAARLRSSSACACKALDGVQELLALPCGCGRIARGEGVGDTVVDMVVEHPESQALERSVHRSDLRE